MYKSISASFNCFPWKQRLISSLLHVTSKSLASHFLGKFIGWEKSPCNEQGVTQTAGVDLDLLRIWRKQLQLIFKLIMTHGRCARTTKMSYSGKYISTRFLHFTVNWTFMIIVLAPPKYLSENMAGWTYHPFTSHNKLKWFGMKDDI